MIRFTTTLALLIPALAPLVEDHHVPWINFVLVAIILALAPLKRPRLGMVPQALIHLILGVILFLILSNSESTPLSHHIGNLLNTVFLASAAARYLWGWRRGDQAATLVFGLFALTSLARNMQVMPFTLLVELYLVVCLFALLRGDASWPGFRRFIHLPALLTGLAVLLSFPISEGLLKADGVARIYIEPYLYDMARNVSGFGGTVNLNGLKEIESSDAVALTLDRGPERLRGRAFERYHAGHWRGQPRARPLARGKRVRLAEGEPQRTVTIQLKRPQRYILVPPGAVEVFTNTASTQHMRNGEVRINREEALAYRVGIARGAHAAWRRAEEEGSSQLPSKVHEEIAELARAWTAGIEGERARVEALRARLASDEFTYALKFKPSPAHRDPILHFLKQRKTGHCEFFASGLALLARGIGLRSRLVTGYLVREHAEDQAIVRAQDAHAWTEIFIDGAWRTVDPTPPGALLERAPEGSSETLAAIRAWFKRALDVLMNLGIWELLGLGAGLIFLVLLWQRVRGPKARGARAEELEGFAPLEALEAALEKQGVRRPAPQSLTRYAARLRRAELEEAAGLVEDCAALRYGQVGDEAEFSARVEGFLKKG